MKRTIRLLLAIVGLVAILAGCARGPKHADIDEALPALKPGYGRIYFFRSSAFIGSPVQPEIRLNNQVIGRSRARSFFFVDRPAGAFVVSSATSVTSSLNFSLYPGEVKYIRTEVTIAMLGVMPGSVSFTIVDESVAEPEVSKLSYIGRTIKPARKATTTDAPKDTTPAVMPPSATVDAVQLPAVEIPTDSPREP